MTWEIDLDVVEREKERADDDRATRESISAFLSDSGSGESVRSVPDDIGEPKRTGGPRIGRQLRPTFRTPAFKSRSLDGRSLRTTLEPASPGSDGAPAPAARAKYFTGWRTAVQQTGSAGSAADKPAQPADASPAGGRVRGRRPGRPKKDQTKAGGSGSRRDVEAATRPIEHAIPLEARVTITDSSHPWHTFAGKIIGDPEKFGLGWFGQRIELDGNHGEAYVRPEQTDWKRKPGRPASAAPALPKAIAKLVPKSDANNAPRAIVPTETERSDARRLFREIGETFNKNRKKSKTAAYAAFRHDLMANLDTLIMGGAIDLKEATTIITNLEQYTKETEAESTETPATILGRWLRMDAAEVAGLEVGEPGELVANEPDEDGEEEELTEAEPDGESVFS